MITRENNLSFDEVEVGRRKLRVRKRFEGVIRALFALTHAVTTLVNLISVKTKVRLRFSRSVCMTVFRNDSRLRLLYSFLKNYCCLPLTRVSDGPNSNNTEIERLNCTFVLERAGRRL